MREFWAVVANEWMKLVRRRRFLIVLLLSLAVVGLFGLVSWHDYKNQTAMSPIQSVQMDMSSLKMNIQQLESQPASQARNQQIAQLQQMLTSDQQQLSTLQAAESQNWRNGVQRSLDMSRQLLQQPVDNTQIGSLAQHANAQSQVLMNQYYLDHNVKPLGWPSINVYQSLDQFLGIAAPIFIPLLVIILVADIVSGESTDGTVKLLLIRPVSRTKILMGKWFVSLVSTFIWTVLLCGVLYGTGAAIMGTRGGAQPVMTGVTWTFVHMTPSGLIQSNGSQVQAVGNYGHVLLLPYWEYLLCGFLFIGIAMMVVATLCILCSVIFRSAMVSTAAAMGSIIIGYIVTKMARHLQFTDWLFPTHLDLMANWTGDLGNFMQQNVGLGNGLFVLFIWAIIGIVIAVWSWARRDVLNV